jgi:hypothetical protein
LAPNGPRKLGPCFYGFCIQHRLFISIEIEYSKKAWPVRKPYSSPVIARALNAR